MAVPALKLSEKRTVALQKDAVVPTLTSAMGKNFDNVIVTTVPASKNVTEIREM